MATTYVNRGEATVKLSWEQCDEIYEAILACTMKVNQTKGA